MLRDTVEARTFETMKAQLIEHWPGQFAVIFGTRLLGTYTNVDDALLAASRAFDQDDVPPGAAIFIAQISDRTSLRVMATPAARLRPVAEPVPGAV
jgi:hypothetical protein